MTPLSQLIIIYILYSLSFLYFNIKQQRGKEDIKKHIFIGFEYSIKHWIRFNFYDMNVD